MRVAVADRLERRSHQTASGVRWNILVIMVVVSMVTYLDRLNISIAAPQIMSLYHLSRLDMGKVFSAFVFAYGIFQLPSGWLADRFGPRNVLTAAIGWWSIFTALTALTPYFSHGSPASMVFSLLTVRFCLGMGESAAWPSFNRAIANWIPPTRRAFAASLPLAGAGLGATATPPLIAWLMALYGWRYPFYVSAGIGLLVAVLWFIYFRNLPVEHHGVNAAELAIIESGHDVTRETAQQTPGSKTPWRSILCEPNVWLIFLTNLSAGYVIYIYLTWFYTYLLEGRHLTMVRGSIYSAGPFIAITLMTPLGGLLGDRTAKRFGKTWGRRLIAMSGMGLAAVALFLGAELPNVNESIIAFSLGAGAVYFSLSAHWATTIDISKKHAGVVAGIMNWGGNTGGMLSPIVVPYIARLFGWAAALESAAGIMLGGSLLWLLIRPEKPLHLPSIKILGQEA